MIPHRYNETSSQPVNDLGGVPAMYDSFGKASARRGYVAGSPSSRHMPRRRLAWQMQSFAHARLPLADLRCRPQPVICPGPEMGQPGKHGKYGITNKAYFASARRISVHLALAFKKRGEDMDLSVNDAFRSVLRDYPDVMNIEQMSKALGISRKTGYKLLKEGTILAMKVGRTYRIPKIHILSYLRVLHSTG